MPLSDIEGVHAAFYTLAATIAKSNTLIRDRYPHSHALHQRCEKSYFGVFWDMPLQLHTFMDAAEVACRISGEEHDALAMRLKEEIKHARCSAASRPKRDRQNATLRQRDTARKDRLQGAGVLRSRVCPRQL